MIRPQMKEYQFKFNSKDIESTNESLMKLWATFLNKGKLGWHYRPFKQGKIIDVGDVDIHGVGSYNVIFMSKTKEIITCVVFKKQNHESLTDKEIEYFNRIDRERTNRDKKEFIFAISLKIKSLFGVKYIYSFQNSFISVYCIDDKQYIEFTIRSYCKEQADEEVLEIAEKILDFLSSQTNSVIELEGIIPINKRTVLSKKISNMTQNNNEWMDEYPIHNSHFILPEYAKEILKKIIFDNSGELLTLLKVFHHFSHAIKLQSKHMQNELIISQIMSSIEVLTELEQYNKTTCKECGQNIFSIRKRVLSLIESHMNEHMKKIFDSYYSTRSKYLHSGQLVSSRQYGGICLPQISKIFQSGCDEYPRVVDINLIEWTGYLIRKKTINFIKNRI